MRFYVEKLISVNSDVAFDIETPKVGQEYVGHVLHVECVFQKDSGYQTYTFNIGERMLASGSIETTKNRGFFFEAHVGLLGLLGEARIRLILCGKAGNCHIATILLKREPYKFNFCGQYNPVLVNGMPRSGTTLLMSKLCAHKNIYTLAKYPFEYRFAYYWMHLLKVLSSPYSAPFDNWYYQTKDDCITPSPYYPFVTESRTWFETKHVEYVARYVHDSIESIYESLAGKSCKNISYFLEKFPGKYVGLFREIFPKTREIIIVRDFRDVFISIKLFNAKRGSDDFNRDKFVSDRDYFMHLGELFSSIVNRFNEKTPLQTIVRYEDLMQNQDETLLKIFKWLNVDADYGPQILDRTLQDEMEAHRTHKSDRASREHWRKYEDSELIAEVSGHFSNALRNAGYNII